MSGVIAFGDKLDQMLADSNPHTIEFSIESVKLIPDQAAHHSSDLYGMRTQQALSLAEIQNPEANRITCLATTTDDDLDQGRPSSWSGAVDQLTSGADDDVRRLLIVSAGNTGDPADWPNYPASVETGSIQDPGQAWNALTVGAYTDKTTIENDQLRAIYDPVAAAGQISPYSTTSLTWKKDWPTKPDIVLEGGNVGIDSSNFATQIDDLSVLTTSSNPTQNLLTTIHATSAASAQATNMAANIAAAYPQMWPETIRALLVHSAKWPEALREQYWDDTKPDKRNYNNILRVAGFGKPDLSLALESAHNSLTLIAEQEMQPYCRGSGNNYKTNEMHLYDLPWPKEALLDLPGETPVRMDVTLSYFIEPGPGEVGWRDKYRYRSHGLDFNVKRPDERIADFEKRINDAARNDDDTDVGGNSVPWALGRQITRSRGSIHRDWWNTTAAQVADAGVVAIFPRTGWWKERNHLGMGERKTRYSLVVSLSLPNIDVDIYTPVATRIAPAIPISAS